MHTVHFYHLMAIVAPPVFAIGARSTRYRWAATRVAGVYSLFVLGMSWVLPLFPAQPKLGPVYWHLTQFTPPEFPYLLIVPALLLDLLWQRTPHWGAWRQALVSGVVFLAAMAAVQWPFADFLMSPWARNWFFGAKYFGYYTSPTSFYLNYRFYATEAGAALWREIAIALATAILMTRFGLAPGEWMQPRPTIIMRTGTAALLAATVVLRNAAGGPCRQSRHLLRRQRRTLQIAGHHTPAAGRPGDRRNRDPQLCPTACARSTWCPCA